MFAGPLGHISALLRAAVTGDLAGGPYPFPDPLLLEQITGLHDPFPVLRTDRVIRNKGKKKRHQGYQYDTAPPPFLGNSTNPHPL